MIINTKSIKLIGTKAVPVTVETSVTSGVGIHLLGLADAAVKETLLRTVTALQATGYRIPGKKIIINITPGDLKVSCTGLDLAIALGLIAASGQKPALFYDLDEYMLSGELSLDGRLRPTPGAYQAIMTAREKDLKGVILPADCLPEVAELLPDEPDVYLAETIAEVIDIILNPDSHMTAVEQYEIIKKKEKKNLSKYTPERGIDWWILNEPMRRAATVAAAGGHPMLVVGQPGSGKSTLSKCVCDLLPELTTEEAERIARTYSVAGRSNRVFEKVFERPYRHPHHTASIAALIGGGPAIVPGEVTLSDGGVLAIEDINELPKSAMEVLSNIMEDKSVTISRLSHTVTMPADFLPVFMMNPCPCGYYGTEGRCTCTPGQRTAFLSRISGRMADRLTLQLHLNPSGRTASGETRPADTEKDFQEAADAVKRAIAIQEERYKNEPYGRNNDVPLKDFDKYLRPTPGAASALENILTQLGLSARAYARILKMARTIADLDGEKDIRPEHIAEAAAYRYLDRFTQPDSF